MTSEDVLPPPVQDAIAIGDTPIVPADTSATTTNARPDAHTQRYDRQLRLWAKSGQSALENADILVVNATATAASSLKNLVLPGIGRFTILDPLPVDGSDCGNNFFLEPSSLGKSRAEEVTKYLLELNSDVQGRAIVQDLTSILSSTPESLTSYSLILAVEVDPNDLLRLSDLAWKHQIPLIKVRSCGFYGLLRVQVNELPIVETHPESLIDLRVHHPFPELIEYAKSFDYAKMDSAEFGHVPAVVILVKALEEYRAEHDGKGPTTTAERKQFTDGVSSSKRQHDDENFDEAVTLFRRAGSKTGIPSEIQELFNDPACENVSASSSNFWLLLNAVRSFTQHPSNPSSLLPLSGALPDMKADTSGYVGLQTIYRTKAKQDLALVRSLLSALLATLEVVPSRVTDDEVETFVKHSAYLQVIRGRSLRMDVDASGLKGTLEEVSMGARYDEVPNRALEIYLGLTAAERFVVKVGRPPGTDEKDEDGTMDHQELYAIAKDLIDELGGGLDRDALDEVERTCQEICRAGASDLPQIAALLGGLVAQEAIKLVTKQYVPLNATCVFNGIASATGIIKA